MNSTQQRCFLSAATHMNFTRAAEELYLTQPALSRNISALEEELELLLFIRHNNVLSITPGGQILYEWMRRAGTHFQQVLESARRANSDRKQALRIGFVNSEIPPQTAADAIAALGKEDPEQEILFDHYHSREIVSCLEDHRIDVAVMLDPAVRANPRFVSQTLSHLRRCVAVPVQHPLAGRGRVSLRAFRDETFISVRPETSVTLSQSVRTVCEACGFTPLLLEAQDTEQQLQWIVSGRGVGLLVENHIKRGNPLYSFLELEEELLVEQVCVWDKLNTNPRIAQFVEQLATR